MSIYDAIETLRLARIKLDADDGGITHRTIAFDMAIKALEQIEKDRWIPVTERLPEEHEWIGTKRFGTTISDEVYVTIEVPSGDRIVKHLWFQNGAIPSYEQRELDVFYKGGKPIAWRPLPEPYKEETE